MRLGDKLSSLKAGKKKVTHSLDVENKQMEMCH